MTTQTKQLRSVQMAGPAHLKPASTTDTVVPGHAEVRVRLELAGICGSDKPGFVWGKDKDGNSPAGFPAHECIGTVLEAPGHPDLVGQRVIAIPNHDAGLREEFCAAVSKTYILRYQLPDTTAILAQPLATVLAAIDRLGDIRRASACVLGLGPIGLMFGYVLRERGAGSLVGYDRQDRSGAPFSSSFDRTTTELESDAAFDIVVDAVGHDQELVNFAISKTTHSGTMLAFGVPDDDIYALNYKAFFRKCLAMIANVQPDWQTYLPLAEEFIAAHPDLGKLVTHVFDVAEAQSAFETAFLLEDPARGKVLISAGSWQ